MLYLVITAIVVAVLFALYVYGFFSARIPGKPRTAIPASAGATQMDRTVAPLLAKHSGQTGLLLVSDNLHAFAIRAAAARRAERSLDLQYYYWKGDLTGSLLAREVLSAADRGVKVRLLIDDINTRGRDKYYRALVRHPNIEVRLFNPTRCRDNAFLRGFELVVRFWSVNRRMHNKAWIADNRIAIVGGRNIGDAYFDASEASNFRDMDVAAIGPVVEETSAIFDRYWNSDVVFPIVPLGFSRKENLRRLRRRLEKAARSPRSKPYLKRVARDEAVGRMTTDLERLHWTADARMIADPPEKATSAKTASWILEQIQPVLMSARRKLSITSPYFIPREGGKARFLKLAERGVAVSILTNSLAATDVAAVHGAYSRYRKALLAGGLKLFELRLRHSRRDPASFFGSRGASLHTKAFIVDDHIGFVGSFNFDPRSVALNTEMGILFDSPELATEMQDVFAEEVSPSRSYRVVLEDDKVGWMDGEREHAAVLRQEPDASWTRRMLAWTISKLPVESHL